MLVQTLSSEKIKFSSDRTRAYPYGMNDQEKIDELKGNGNQYLNKHNEIGWFEKLQKERKKTILIGKIKGNN